MSSQDPRVAVAQLGTVDPTGSPVANIFKVPAACRGTVHKLYMVNGTAHAMHATNTNTVVVNRVRAAVATQIATQTNTTGTSGAAAIAADVPWEIPLDSDALAELQAGDVLQAVFTEGAAGMDLSEVTMFTEWSPGTGPGYTS